MPVFSGIDAALAAPTTALRLFGKPRVEGQRRVAVGPFTEDHMISLENLTDLGHKAPGGDATKGVLLPIETVLDGIPALAIDEEQSPALHHRAVEIDEQLVLQAGYRHADLAIPDGQRQLFVPGDALIQFLQRDLAWSGLIIG